MRAIHGGNEWDNLVEKHVNHTSYLKAKTDMVAMITLEKFLHVIGKSRKIGIIKHH